MNKIISEIGSASFLLALLTGMLYVSGDAYLSSYLQELELPAGLFQYPLNEVLSHGFYMFFIGGIFLVIPSIFIATLFFLYAHMIGEVSNIGVVRKIWGFLFHPENNVDQPRKPKLVSKVVNLSLASVVFVFFLALLLFTTYQAIEFSSKKGREGAKSRIKELISMVEHSEIKMKGFSLLASTIRCSSTHCALYVPEISEIRVVPVADIEAIRKQL